MSENLAGRLRSLQPCPASPTGHWPCRCRRSWERTSDDDIREPTSLEWLTAAADLDRPASKVEARLQKQVLKLVRTLEWRTRGLYAEVLIAETLGEAPSLATT